MKKNNIGSISVISTPIGNSEDITIRAIKTLNEMVEMISKRVGLHDESE